MTPDVFSPRSLRLSLRADLAEVKRARRLIDEIQEICALTEERTFDIKVAVCEACANGIEHASSSILLVAWLLPDRILFEITNDGGFAPGIRKDVDGRQRGLGLPLMVSLADQVNVSRVETGATRVSLTFWLPPGASLSAGLAGCTPRQIRGGGVPARDAIFATLEAVAAAPTVPDAGAALLEGSRAFTGCEGGMLRLLEDTAKEPVWLPAIVSSGLSGEFLREEALIKSTECLCGRVCTGITDPGLPFFTQGGSFSWGSAQALVEAFGAEALGEVRGRCIADGYESIAIFPLSGEVGPIGVLHLVDSKKERFATTAPVVEWACRVAGRIISTRDRGERAEVVRAAVRGLPPRAGRPPGGPALA